MDSHEGSPFDPPSLHKYLYASASPVIYVDPSGNSFVGTVVSFAMNTVLSAMTTLSRILPALFSSVHD